MITDLEIATNYNGPSGIAWIRDGVGKRYCVALGGSGTTGYVQHVSLTTPIVLPVGSPLFVDMSGIGTFEVNLLARVVNL